MTLQERAQAIQALLLERFKQASTELHYANTYQLLVAVILSAQCTDQRVNATTPALFQTYPTIHDLARANFDQLKAIIKSISYPNNKAKHLINMASQVVRDFGAQIPRTQKELKSLAGVGQKSANVILSVAFEQNYLAVDTHVFRVAHRLGLSHAKSAVQTEEDLTKLFQENLATLHHALILFGRYTCKAIKPDCSECFLRAFCQSRANFKPH